MDDKSISIEPSTRNNIEHENDLYSFSYWNILKNNFKIKLK
jgi:hypothetical protein